MKDYTHVRMPLDVRDKMLKESKVTGIPMTWLFRKAVDAYIGGQRNEVDLKPKPKKRKPSPKFVKPSPREVKEYIDSIAANVDSEKFWHHYEANGWKVGKNPMKNWKSAVSTWNKRNGEKIHEQSRGVDTRTRAKRVHDRCKEIAAEDIRKNGFTDTLG